jgi:hypothetical protein
MQARAGLGGWLSTVALAGACETAPEGVRPSEVPEPIAAERSAPKEPEPVPAPKPVADARDPEGAVLLLAELCARGQQGEHAWVAARVKLPLQGIYSINDIDEDPHVHRHDTLTVEDFQHMAYCRMLPPPGTALQQFDKTDATASGTLVLGKLPHRIEFDLGQDPPRLVTLDAQVPGRPIPPRPTGKLRDHDLAALPPGFTEKEPPGAAALRRKIIDALQKDPRCIEDYVARHMTAARFEVIVEAGTDGTTSLRVEPFQLVRASLLSCLRTQLPQAWPTIPGANKTAPTSALIEVQVYVSADELPPGTPTLEMVGETG